ncbi:hypothetical protein ABEB36_008339 [Hypothenemus hampei]|uniref:Uncharacterized protein n=1 Tax=Hypothenemus hampei TaxID=57062 RepID=A0ABD1ELJ0_HYPHA
MAEKETSESCDPGEDLELDYEPEETGSAADVPLSQTAMLEKLLGGGLAKSLQEIMAKEAAKAMAVVVDQLGAAAKPGKQSAGDDEQASGSSSPCVGSCLGVSRTRAGMEILPAFDPDDRDCNVNQWLNKIEQLGKIHE